MLKLRALCMFIAMHTILLSFVFAGPKIEAVKEEEDTNPANLTQITPW